LPKQLVLLPPLDFDELCRVAGYYSGTSLQSKQIAYRRKVRTYSKAVRQAFAKKQQILWPFCAFSAIKWFLRYTILRLNRQIE
jgi:hypothetical protein